MWLAKDEIALLFERDRTAISKHINNIYKEGEFDEQSTCAKNAHVPQSRNKSFEKVFKGVEFDAVKKETTMAAYKVLGEELKRFV